MPWHIEVGGGTCGPEEFAVLNSDTGATEGCHDTREAAERQVAALNANYRPEGE